MGPNALYVMVARPAVKAAEYDLLCCSAEALGADAGTPENQEMFKKYTAAFAAGPNRSTEPVQVGVAERRLESGSTDSLAEVAVSASVIAQNFRLSPA